MLFRYSQYEEQPNQTRQREMPMIDSPNPVGTPIISARCLSSGLSVVVAAVVGVARGVAKVSIGNSVG